MSEQTVQVTGSSGDEDALRELAIRLLTLRLGQLPTDQTQQPQLFVGALPPELSIELPLPEESRLLGSFVWRETTVELDVARPGDEVFDSYRERLTTAGWSDQERFGHQHGGFVHSAPFERTYTNFFAPDDHYTLSVLTAPMPEEHTAVELTLLDGVERFRPPGRPHRHDVMAVLPLVRPPRKATQMSRGGGGGPDHVESRAELDTDLDLAAIANHYVAELERGGWRRLDSGLSGPAAWSEWSFANEQGAPWHGFLLIARRYGRTGKYTLLLEADAESEQDQGNLGGADVSSGGGYSYAALLGRQAHTVMTPQPPEPPAKPETQE